MPLQSAEIWCERVNKIVVETGGSRGRLRALLIARSWISSRLIESPVCHGPRHLPRAESEG